MTAMYLDVKWHPDVVGKPLTARVAVVQSVPANLGWGSDFLETIN